MLSVTKKMLQTLEKMRDLKERWPWGTKRYEKDLFDLIKVPN